MPKISVLVPIYNVERYIERCLDSLLKQTFEDIEIICINDGSTDASGFLVDKFRFWDKRIKLVEKSNTGYGHSMNIGLEIASGDYIGIVESDDFIEENMYEELYKIAQANPDINIIKSQWRFFHTGNNEFITALFDYDEGILNIPDNQDILTTHPSIWSAIYKREFLNKNNIRFLETPGASFQDISFLFKALTLAEKIYFSKQELLYYRVDNYNSSIHARNKLYAISNEHEEMARFMDEHPEIHWVFDTQRIHQYAAYKDNMIRIVPEMRNEFLVKFRETFKKYLEEGSLSDKFFEAIPREEVDILITDTEKYKEIINEYENYVRNQKGLFTIK